MKTKSSQKLKRSTSAPRRRSNTLADFFRSVDNALSPFPTEQSSLEEIGAQVHRTAVEHGWWEQGDRNVGEVMMLMVTELAEAFEHYRENRPLDAIHYADKRGKTYTEAEYARLTPAKRKDLKVDGVPVELADILIRLLDFCHHNKIPLMRAVILKMRYNDSREWRHGGKKC